MTWKISDILIMAFTVVLSLNLLIVFLLLSQRFLDRNLDKKHLNCLFKFILLYMPVLLVFITGYILYTSTFHDVLLADSDDFSHYYVIGNKTLSMTTGLGNYWLFTVIVFIWGVGVIYFGIIRYLKDKNFLRTLKKCCLVNKDSKIFDLLSAIEEELHIKNTITVYTNNLIPTPFMTGFFRTKLFMPQVDFSGQELELILRHELIHCKSNDYFFRRWIHYLCTLFWFNPAIYTITNSFLEINEMACDEAVLKNKSKDVRSRYAHLIIHIAETYLPLKCGVAFTGCTDNSLEKRIRNIMKTTATNRKLLFLAVMAAAIFICPATAIAAASGASDLQGFVSEKIEAQNSTQMEAQINSDYIEYTGISRNSDADTIIISIAPKGVSMIDCDISSKKRMITNTINLSKDAQVHIWIHGDSSTDKFEIGLIDDNNNFFYTSSFEGQIDYTFKRKNAGYYSIFVQETTDNSNDAHISGCVVIDN